MKACYKILVLSVFVVTSCGQNSSRDDSYEARKHEHESELSTEDTLLADVQAAAEIKTVEFDNMWQFGPGGGGRMEGPAIYPHNHKIMFLGSDMQTLARSHNSGVSWRVLDLRKIGQLKARYSPALHFGPLATDRIFAKTQTGLMQSSDTGFTWSEVSGPWHNLPQYRDLGPDLFSLSSKTSGFAIAGFNASVDAAGRIMRQPLLFMTTNVNQTPVVQNGKVINPDGRVVWTSMKVPTGCLDFRNVLYPTPGYLEHLQVVLVCAQGVYVSSDGGKRWQLRVNGLPNKGTGIIDAAYGLINATKARLFVLVKCSNPELKNCFNPVYTSLDAGLSWTSTDKNLPAGVKNGLDVGQTPASFYRNYSQLAVSPLNGNQIYLVQQATSIYQLDSQGRPVVGISKLPDGEGQGQVFMSKNGGMTWTRTLHRHPSSKNYNMASRTWRTMGDWGWRLGPDGISVLPSNPNMVFLGDLVSYNAGASWISTDTQAFVPKDSDIFQGEPAPHDPQVPRGGYPVMGAVDYAFHPKEPHIQFIAMEDFAGWRTINGAKTWEYTRLRIREPGEHNPRSDGPTNTLAYAFDGDIVWQAGSFGHNVPNWSELPRVDFGYIGYSLDFGRTWNQVGYGAQSTAGTSIGITTLPKGGVTSVYVDKSIVGKTRIWTAVLGEGYYWSEDSGRSWNLDVEGLPVGSTGRMSNKPYKIGKDPHGRYFALNTITPRGMNYSPGSIYLKNHHLEPWKELGDRTKIPYPVAVTFDPHDPDVFYLSSFSTPQVNKPVVGGLWKTSNGGSSWNRLGEGSLSGSVFDMTIHPKNANCLVASVINSGLWASYDKGKTWALVENFPPNNPYKLRWDPRPNVKDRLVVTTYGQGLWSMQMPCKSPQG